MTIIALYKGKDPTTGEDFHGYAYVSGDSVGMRGRELGPPKDITQHFIQFMIESIPMDCDQSRTANYLRGHVPEPFKKHRAKYFPYSEIEVRQLKEMINRMPSQVVEPKP